MNASAATTRPGRPLPGYAGLAREDVADAKRGRPDQDLSLWAARRGLAFAGTGVPAGYEHALPADERLRFNVSHGETPDGRPACLAHWLRAWPVMADGDPGHGTFYGLHWKTPSSGERWWRSIFDPHYLPFIGWMFDLRTQKQVGGFTKAIGVPCTMSATLVPEAAFVEDLVIDNAPKPRWVEGHRERLDGRGLSGWTLMSDRQPPSQLVDALLTPRVRAVLGQAAGHPFFELRVRRGVVTLCRNGFVGGDAGLDALFDGAGVVGDALQTACAGASC